MKTSVHLGKGSASHNDRSFDKTNTEHDIIKFQGDNRYKDKTFKEAEREIFQSLYGERIKQINDNYIKRRKKNNCINIDSFMKQKQNSPTELILQVGGINESIDKNKLREICVDFARQVNNEYKTNIKILNMAIHNDEATPHAHLRYTFFYEKDGITMPGKTKALKELGIERPDMSKPESKYNNSLMTFTEQIRTKFQNICIEKGIEIDTVPNPEKIAHKEIREYKSFKLKEVSQLKLMEKKDDIVHTVTDRKNAGIQVLADAILRKDVDPRIMIDAANKYIAAKQEKLINLERKVFDRTDKTINYNTYDINNYIDRDSSKYKNPSLDKGLEVEVEVEDRGMQELSFDFQDDLSL